MDLVYRVGAVGELTLGECVIRHTRDAGGRAWWQLWVLVPRRDTGDPIYVAVTVNPNGPYLEIGPSGRRTWGLTRSGETWQVAPSIDAAGDRHPDGTRGPSPWHETPRIVGVPPGERWIAFPA